MNIQVPHVVKIQRALKRVVLSIKREINVIMTVNTGFPSVFSKYVYVLLSSLQLNTQNLYF